MENDLNCHQLSIPDEYKHQLDGDAYDFMDADHAAAGALVFEDLPMRLDQNIFFA